MAQKVEVLLVDDLTGQAADETVAFSLDGVQYEIDLSAENAARLREELDRFVHAARKTSGRRTTGGGRGRKSAGGPSTQEVRAWAKAQGIEINERGRIPADILAQYRQAKST